MEEFAMAPTDDAIRQRLGPRTSAASDCLTLRSPWMTVPQLGALEFVITAYRTARDEDDGK
jgi:hypothetical protein